MVPDLLPTPSHSLEDTEAPNKVDQTNFSMGIFFISLAWSCLNTTISQTFPGILSPTTLYLSNGIGVVRSQVRVSMILLQKCRTSQLHLKCFWAKSLPDHCVPKVFSTFFDDIKSDWPHISGPLWCEHEFPSGSHNAIKTTNPVRLRP